MMDDDGVNHFGTHTDQPEAAHWDTPEWRARMEAEYAAANEALWLDCTAAVYTKD